MYKTHWWTLSFLITLPILLYIGFWFEIISPIVSYGSTSFNHTLGFEHIYVISLPYRIDRRARMEAIADELDLDFDFFPAVSKYDKKTLDGFEGDIGESRKACWISHYNVFQSIADNEYFSALILEDDVDMEMDILPIMYGIHRFLPADWETLYLGHCGTDSQGTTLGESYGFELFKSRHPVCTHAYAVSSIGVRKLLKEFAIADRPLDFRFYDLIGEGNITSYSLEPSLIVQSKSSSDVSPDKDADYNDDSDNLRRSTLKFLRSINKCDT